MSNGTNQDRHIGSKQKKSLILDFSTLGKTHGLQVGLLGTKWDVLKLL